MEKREPQVNKIKLQRFVLKLSAAITCVIYLIGLIVNIDNIKDIRFIILPAVLGLLVLIPIFEYFYRLPMRVLLAGYIDVDKVKERKIWLVCFSFLCLFFIHTISTIFVFPFL
jgi:uncharacterized protein YebE (UPF0316 family)